MHALAGAPVFELAAAAPAGSAQNVDLGKLLVRRPVAAIALVPKSALLFAAGAVAGALGTPPLLLSRNKKIVSVTSMPASASEGGQGMIGG